jgi:acyl carrier protein
VRDHSSRQVDDSIDRRDGSDNVSGGITRERMSRVWSEVIGLANIAPHDDLYRLGGDSLQAAEIVLRIAEEFGVTIEAGTLLDGATLGELSSLIDDRLAGK